MRLKLVACEVFRREFCFAAANSRHVIDLQFQSFGLHDTPDQLRIETQKQIDQTPADRYPYILIGYGLCSRGTADLQARNIPLIIPRAHDCITLFLGSRARYNQEFLGHPGTYWYSAGWIERRGDSVSQQGMLDTMHQSQLKSRYDRYVDKYGEDNAKYLIEMEDQWVVNYDRAAFIDTGIGLIDEYRKFTQELAKSRGWEYEELEGDNTLIHRFMNCEWDDENFLEVPPGHHIADVYDEGVITAKPSLGI